MSSFSLDGQACWSGRPVAHRIVDAGPRQRVVTTGTVTSVAVERAGGGPAYRVTLDDGTGTLDLLFVGRLTVAAVGVGTRCSIEGTVSTDGGRLVVWNPFYVLEG